MLLIALAASTCAYTLHSSLQTPLATARSASSSSSLVVAADARRCEAPRLQFDMGKMGDDLKKKMGLKPPDSGLTEEESRQMEKRLKEGEMSFDDFLKQVQVMQKAAGLQSMLAKGPFGGGQQVSEEQVKEGQKKLTRYGEYVGCMDGIERANPKLLIDEAMSLKQGNSRATAPRLQRIAEASGATLDDVGRFVMEFNVMRTAAVRFARGDSPEDIKKGMMAEQMAGGAAPNRKQRRMADKKAKSPTAAKRGFAPPPPKVR